MKRISTIVAATAAIGLAGCYQSPATVVGSRSSTLPGITPALPSVAALGCSTWQTRPGYTALVHIETLLAVRHASAPQEGATGRVTVSSIDVAFLAGRTPVGWALQATPPSNSGLLLGNGRALLDVSTYRLYLYGHWTRHCRVMRVYWLPGRHS